MRNPMALFVAVIVSLNVSVSLAANRPNIVFIFSDDHAQHAIGAYGSRINQTPNIDRIAQQGMLFRNAFVANSICTPSRATILTGKHSHLNGAFNVGDKFDGTQQTFPKLLQQAGYQTAIIGKWHLGHGGKSDPSGFDYWNVLVDQGPYYNPPMIENGTRVQHTGYTTDVLTDQTIKWLEERRDAGKPFFLASQHKAPHREWAPGPKHINDFDDVEIPEPPDLFDDYSGRASPARTQEMTVANHLNEGDLALRPPKNLTAEQLKVWREAFDEENDAFRKANLSGKARPRWQYQRYIKNYLRSVASVDDSVGAVLDYLEESGLAKNTIVIYASDQGFYLGDHGWYDKRFMYEPSLRTPYIVKWPGVIKPGSQDTHLVQNLDFAQTFLDMAGVEQPKDMQGRSLVPLMRGESPADWRDAIYYHYYDFPAVHSVKPHFGVRTDRYKLIHYYTLDEWELFDLEKDPREMRSVHHDPAYADVRRGLEKKLKSLQEKYRDTEPTLDPAALQQRAIRADAAHVAAKLLLKTNDAPAPGEPPTSPQLARKPFVVGAWCTPTALDGVIVAHGGAQRGYSLYLQDGVPRFATREKKLLEVAAPEKVATGKPVDVAGMLNDRSELLLMVNGELVAKSSGLYLQSNPAEGLSIGRDAGETSVGPYKSELPFEGELRDIRIYQGVPRDAELKQWAKPAG